MIAPPLIFGAFAVLAGIGMFREDPNALPSAREGQPAPPVVLTQFPGKQIFDDTTLRHPAPNPIMEYADRDVLTELAGPARQRGMKLYVRWYQVGASTKAEIRNLETVLTVDMNGKPGHKPCWFNPDYRAWLVAMMKGQTIPVKRPRDRQ